MATWLTHLRVAERVADKINISDRSLFFAGSIAPDSDMFSDISHWCANGDKTTCDVKGFYINYISDQRPRREYSQFSQLAEGGLICPIILKPCLFMD